MKNLLQKISDPFLRLRRKQSLRRPALALERLEDRVTPANLDINAVGNAMLVANPAELNDISLFRNPGTGRYEFTDNGGPITVSGAGAGPAGANVQGAGTNTVTGLTFFITAI